MLNKNALLDSIRSDLSEATGASANPEWVRDLSGGDINRAALICSGDTNWFLKYHQNAPDGMFAAEAQALTEIASHECIRVPYPIAHGECGDTSWLVLEHLELGAHGSAALLGEQLAAMHDYASNEPEAGLMTSGQVAWLNSAGDKISKDQAAYVLEKIKEKEND